jgi:hypothetical protein
MNRVRCPSCGAWIVFLITATRGRPMPCNPEVVHVNLIPEKSAVDADREASWRRTVLITPDGEVVRGYALPSPRPTSVKVDGRISHYVTCPSSTYYRERSRAKRAAQRAQAGEAIDGPR